MTEPWHGLTPDADLSNADLTTTTKAIAAFWSDAETHTLEDIRTRWVDKLYPDMPRGLAKPIIDGCESRRSKCS